MNDSSSSLSDLVGDIQSSTDYRSYISRKDWNFRISDLSDLVEYDIRFLTRLKNLETDKKRKSLLASRLCFLRSFYMELENYISTLFILSDDSDEEFV